MNSKPEKYTEAYVWIWLPGEIEPVVAGKLTAEKDTLVFNYGKSYLERNNAIAIYDLELPLRPGVLPLPKGLTIPGCIRDGAPDAWGRRVLLNRLLGRKGKNADVSGLDELTYLLESGSDRIGALDFQRSPVEYAPRSPVNASLEELLRSAERVEKGIPLNADLDEALHHGSSIGGARPKALIEHQNKKYIAKFSSTTDIYSVVKAEFIAMRLAKRSGLQAAEAELTTALGKDVLLIERFDRIWCKKGWQRRPMLSALTLLGLDEMMARYASYQDLAEIIRHKFTEAPATLKELFARIVFNILVGNTDDHARNHAAFWNGETLSLTPAYDICPQGRSGNEATQAMLIGGDNRMSRISSCLEAAHQYLLSPADAREIVSYQLTMIGDCWNDVCQQADLGEIDRRLLWGRQFLNPFAFDDLSGENASLRTLSDETRKKNAP
ncbi:MAG: type II toxin-antitoxin system HipA family toxin [Desulfuromonadales bacterium]|nr:type II toxin-antitoxin system HipA family toxin [Desulfuromonadales bacterium]MDW7757704.1 type II toxin-antitoxin system HipA family toxin [Desulfuromonadales bacterium]